jgi:hypothetical protein
MLPPLFWSFPSVSVVSDGKPLVMLVVEFEPENSLQLFQLLQHKAV